MLNNIKIQKVGFFLRPKKKELKEHFFKFKNIFEDKKIEVLIHNDSAKMLEDSTINGNSCEEICSSVDILISIGGDGTLLSTVRKSYKYNKPVLGINAGNLGFLVDINLNRFEQFIDKLIAGEFKLENRSLLNVKIKNRESFAFNDIVVHGTNRLKMINIDVYAQTGFLNNYQGDGLIVSTPTGSTAYNLASNGPILYPLIDGFVLTPISPHSLTQRPLVLPSRFKISIEVKCQDGFLVLDGQEEMNFKKLEKISVSIAEKPVSIIREVNYNYFNILKEKLKWGN
jgi:NAD+ kinase